MMDCVTIPGTAQSAPAGQLSPISPHGVLGLAGAGRDLAAMDFMSIIIDGDVIIASWQHPGIAIAAGTKALSPRKTARAIITATRRRRKVPSLIPRG